MPDYNFSTIAEILGDASRIVSDIHVDTLLTDSRKILNAHSAVFFALNSATKNTNLFIADAYKKGVRCFVSSELSKQELTNFPEANLIFSTNPLDALQKLVAFHRKRLSLPVIGITGSNGKTIVKEWLYQMLHSSYTIARSPKSYNSQIGVPLSVWLANKTHNLGIFEAGISRTGEMDLLEKIIKPEIGVFTFLGAAHASGFSSLQEKIHEKLQLFKESKVLIYCADQPMLHTEIEFFKENTNQSLKLFSWSRKPGSTLTVTKFEKQNKVTTVTCNYTGNTFESVLPFTDVASIHNALTCLCVCLYLNIPIPQIQNALAELKPIAMRLELKEGLSNCSIINDSYNSDIHSLTIALDFLMQQQQHAKKTIIISDMLQTGRTPEELYKIIAHNISQKNVNRLIGIGPEISSQQHVFSKIKQSSFYKSTRDFLNDPVLFQNEAILLKGSRVFEFEHISRLLEQKQHETVLEINLNSLRHNLNVYRQQLKSGVKLMAMVKAFSYGAGSFEIANVLQHEGVDYLAVAYADEGVGLRKAGVRLPMMVMNAEEAGFQNLIDFDLEPEIYSFQIAGAFIRFLKLKKITGYPVHIKLDTGMHRLGFEPQDQQQLSDLLMHNSELKVISMFTHLAASDDPSHKEFTIQQSDTFLRMSSEIERQIGYSIIKHMANSSAIHNYPQFHLDMVRLGIGLYGVDSNPLVQDKLLNVTTLKTTISQIKTVPPGESVGYSRKDTVNTETTIATVRIGYADGYPRLMSSGNGKMMVNDQYAPVIGNVCMDMTMLNITGIDAKEGEEVIVFGEAIPVSEIAHNSGTISYEILTGISQRVRRVYFEE